VSLRIATSAHWMNWWKTSNYEDEILQGTHAVK